MEDGPRPSAFVQAQRGWPWAIFRTAHGFREHYTTFFANSEQIFVPIGFLFVQFPTFSMKFFQ